MSIAIRFAVAAASFLFGSIPAGGAAELRVLISADMEGIAGVTTMLQASPGGREYERSRAVLTAEVNAAVQGAYEAGATEVLVVDAHGDMQNVDLDALDRRAGLIRSWPRRLAMLEGIDATFAAAVFLGYHEKEGTANAVLAHTFNMSQFYSIRLDDREVGEFELNALAAGDFRVPVVFVSGDDAICRTARAAIPGIETVVSKHAISFGAARLRNPEDVRTEIRAAVRRGVANRSRIAPYASVRPSRLAVSYKSVVAADVTSNLPGAQRLDARTIAFEVASASGALVVLSAVQLANRAKDGSEQPAVH